MNEDIKILREALARYRDFVEVPEGDPKEVPLYCYNSAKAVYAEACSPERIRRLLDDAERYQYIRGANSDIQGLIVEPGRWTELLTDEELDAAIDKKRKA